jgi:hypothetical protein
MTSASVASALLGRIGSRGTSFPGWLSKLLRGLFMGLPRVLASRILGSVMRGMSQ